MADVTPSYIGQLSADGRWRWDGTGWKAVDSSAWPSMPSWMHWKVRHEATWQAVAWVCAVGVLTDQALRAGTPGLAAALTFIIGSAAILAVGSLQRAEARALVLFGVIFAVWFAIRASPWLLWPDLVAAVAFLGLAASFAVRGSILELGAAELAARAVQVSLQFAAGPAFIGRPVVAARSRFATFTPFLRGVLIAIPIAVLIAILLASADVVFASFFNINLDFGQLALDGAYLLVGVVSAAGLLRAAASEPIGAVQSPAWRLGATEALVVLAVLDAVFVAFAVAQVLAATGAASDTLRSAGVTYSDYARSGFFQLLWVSGITLVVLFAFSRITNFGDRSTRVAFTVLSEIAIALTVLIVLVAFRRLSLYEQEYGFTMLRLYSHVFAVWIGVVFLLLAADFLGLFRPRHWFLGATLITATALLLALNVANPEAVVVALNTNHAQSAHKIDAQYLSELSADATPALLASRSAIDPQLRAQIDAVACAGARRYSPAPPAFNWSQAQAADARRGGCS